MKKFVIALTTFAVAAVALYFAMNMPGNDAELDKSTVTVPEQIQGNEPGGTGEAESKPVATTTVQSQDAKPAADVKTAVPDNKTETVIGETLNGRNIVAYHYGNGAKEILLVGGIHGGYAWNTALLAYQLMDYLKANPSAIPANIKVTIIPVLNPDGLSKVVSVTGPFSASDVSSSADAKVSGRFNGTPVDLNRNFDCGWKAEGVWQNKSVSGGTAPFSERESAAVRDYAKDRKLAAVVGWYSAGGAVYASSCGKGILPETQTITDVFAKASGYPAYKNFASYQVSGDMTDWFAKNNVPAFGVLLTTANDTELAKNLAGIKAILEYYSK